MAWALDRMVLGPMHPTVCPTGCIWGVGPHWGPGSVPRTTGLESAVLGGPIGRAADTTAQGPMAQWATDWGMGVGVPAQRPDHGHALGGDWVVLMRHRAPGLGSDHEAQAPGLGTVPTGACGRGQPVAKDALTCPPPPMEAGPGAMWARSHDTENPSLAPVPWYDISWTPKTQHARAPYAMAYTARPGRCTPGVTHTHSMPCPMHQPRRSTSLKSYCLKLFVFFLQALYFIWYCCES